MLMVLSRREPVVALAVVASGRPLGLPQVRLTAALAVVATTLAVALASPL